MEENMEKEKKTLDFDQFYAERVASFERERSLFEHYIRLVKPENDESHELEWESRNLVEERRLADQAVLSVESKLKAVQDEIADVSKEIKEMTHAQTLRREQIDRLTRLARPVGKDVTYIYPDLFPPHPDSDPALKTSSKARKAELKASEQRYLQETAVLFKTIKTGDVMKLEGRIHDETVRATAYLRDLQAALRETEDERFRTRLKYQALREDEVAEAQRMWQEVDRNEFQCFYAVAELLRLRYRILVAQRLVRNI
jgi:hypothetical protein